MVDHSPESEAAMQFLDKVRGCSNQEIYKLRLLLYQNLCEKHSKEFADQVEMHLTFYQLGVDASNPPKRILLLVYHGIRTNAEWVTTLKRILRDQEEEVVVDVIGYGFFNVIFFLCPVFTRCIPVWLARKKTRQALQRNDGKEVVVLAHSFGTYVLTKILKKTEIQLRPDRIILCGSVLKTNYNWFATPGCPIADNKINIVNDCGDRDWWPVFATFATFGFGPSGTLGFKCSGIEDRHHLLGHSDYFKKNAKLTGKTGEEFIKEFWLPFILEGNIVNSNHVGERKAAPYIMQLLQFLRIPNLLFIFILYWLWKSWPMLYTKFVAFLH